MEPTDIETPVQKYFKIQDLGILVANLVNTALLLASIICLAYLIWGGLDWITSQGEKAQYEEARNKITYALLGLGIVAVSWLIWQLAIYFLGIGEVVDGQVIFRLGLD